MDLAEAQSMPREGMDYDVVIVGRRPGRPRRGDPAEAARARPARVVVVEKGSEVGAHILSGAVIDPIGLDRLLPDWREDPDAPLKTQVTDDRFYVLGPAGSVRLPNVADAAADGQPRQLHRLARQRRALAGAAGRGARRRDLSGLRRGRGAVRRGRRGDGRRHRRHGHLQDRRGRRTASPAAWSCAANTCSSAKARAARCPSSSSRRFGLAEGREPQKFGIGLKELWQVAPDKHQPGLVQHSFGWPLDNSHRRRLVPLPPRGQPRGRRLRGPPQLPEPARSRPSTSSSASRRTRWCATPSWAASASATARAPSPRAAGSRCRS